MKSKLSTFLLYGLYFSVISVKLLPKPRSMLSSKSFIVLTSTLRSMNHFEFIIRFGVRLGSKFILVHEVIKLA